MTPEELLVTTVKSLASAVITELFKTLVTHGKNDIIGSAIQETEVALRSRYGGLDEQLESWRTQPEIALRVDQFIKGGKPSAEDMSVFIDRLLDVGFYVPTDTRREAAEVLGQFLKNLENALLRSQQGLVYQTQVLRSEHNATRQCIDEGVEGLRQLILETRAPAVGPYASDVLSGDARVAKAKALLEEGRPSDALSALSAVQVSLQAGEVSDLAYDYHEYAGLAEAELHHLAEAERLLRRGVVLKPTRANAHGNLAQLLLLQGKHAEAITEGERGLGLEAENQLSLQVLAQAHSVQGNTAVAREYAKRVNDPANRGHILGIIALNASDWETARYELEAAHAANESKEEIVVLLAQAYSNHAQTMWQRAGGAPWTVRSEESGRLLQRALELLNAVEDRLRLREDKTLSLQAHSMSALIRAFLDDPLCVSDLRRGLELGEMSLESVGAVSDFLLRHGRAGEARAPLERVRGKIIDEHRADLATMWVRVVAETTNPQAALDLLDGEMGHLIPPGDLVLLKIDLLLTAGRVKDAEGLLESLPTDPEDWRLGIGISEVMARKDDVVGALETLAAYESRVGIDVKWRLTLSRAMLCMKTKRWEEAAAALDLVMSVDAPAFWQQQYAAALVNSDRVADALEYLRTVRAAQGDVPTLLAIESRILEDLGNLKEAGYILDRLISLDGENPTWWVRRAFVAYREGELPAALQQLAKIDDVGKLSMGDGREAVAILLAGGEDKRALEGAYRWLVAHQDESEAWMRYLGCFMRASARFGDALRPERIDVGVVVDLKDRHGVVQEFEVVDESGVGFCNTRHAAVSAFAKAVLGKRVGDLVTLRDDALVKDTREVMQLRSKYVYAFHTIQEEFHGRFPEAKGLWVFGPGDDFKQTVLTSLDGIEEDRQRLGDHYQRLPLPIAAIAQFGERSEVDTWLGMCQGNLGPIHVAHVNSAERAAEEQGLVDSRELVVDVTSTLALNELGVLGRVGGAGFRILVPQSVIDVIDSAHEMSTVHPKMVLGKEGGQYLRDEVTSERAHGVEEYFAALATWLRRNATASSVQAPPRGKYLKRNEILTKAAIDAIAIAKESSGTLIAEDFRLRALARGEDGVKGAFSLPLIKEMGRRNQMSEEEISLAKLRMLSWGYYFISITGKDLVMGFIREGGEVGPLTKRALRELSDDRVTITSAVIVIVDFVKEVWLQPIAHERKTGGLFEGLEALASRRDWAQAVRLLTRVLQSRFRINPLHLNEIESGIAVWRRVQRK